MFRNQMNNSQHSTPPELGLDVDENYEFSSSKLKLSSTSLPTSRSEKGSYNNNNNMDQNQQSSAVLSGTDVVSPLPGSPILNAQQNQKSNSNSYQSTDTQPPNTTLSTIDPTKPKVGSPRHFFSFRQGLFDQAVNDTITILLRPSNDVDLQGSWLLTEVSHWDHEKEKIVILTSRSLLTVKYDFIAMRVLDHTKTPLNSIDKIIKGFLSYPSSSLIPERNNPGMRLLWNKGQPLPAATSWNPFAKDIPWKTFTNHPLHGYEDHFNSVPPMQPELNEKRLIYSIDNFHQALTQLFTAQNIENNHINYNCQFEDGPIVQQNYIGLGALVHNKNNLGFFKVRGKFSF